MKDFFESLNTAGQPKRSDIIEKDYQLHRLLYQISKNNYLQDKIIFMMDLYKRYRENIELYVRDIGRLSNNEELKLMLIPPPSDLINILNQISGQLEEIRSYFSER